MDGKFWSLIAGGILICLCCAGCASQAATPELSIPTQTPIPRTLTPSPVDSPGDLLVFGDSDMWYAYEFYVADFETALGTPITVYDKTSSPSTTAYFLSTLQNNEHLRELISMAEMVAFNIPIVHPQMGGYCYRPNVPIEDGCFKETADEFAANTRQIIQEIKTLIGDRDVVIRLQNGFIPVDWWREQGLANRIETCLACYAKYFELEANIAAEEGIPLVDVFHAFNGQDLDQNPSALGLVGEDGIHANEAGAKKIADLYVEIGFTSQKP